MKVPQYELKRYRTIVRNEAMLREMTGVHKALYVAQNAEALDQAKTALVTGDIKTPSIPSNDSKEDDETLGEGAKKSSSSATTGWIPHSYSDESTGGHSRSYFEERSSSSSEKTVHGDEDYSFEINEAESKESEEESTFNLQSTKDSSDNSFDKSGAGGSESKATKEVAICDQKWLEENLTRRLNTATVRTRSMTAAMRGGRTASNANKGMASPRNSGKSGEAFIPWKENDASGGDGGAPVGRGVNVRGGRSNQVLSSRTSSMQGGPANVSIERNVPSSRTATRSPTVGYVASSSRTPDVQNGGNQRFKPPQAVGQNGSRGGSGAGTSSDHVHSEQRLQSSEGGTSRRASLCSAERLRAQFDGRIVGEEEDRNARRGKVLHMEGTRGEDVSAHVQQLPSSAVQSPGIRLPVRKSSTRPSSDLDECNEALPAVSLNVQSRSEERLNGMGCPEVRNGERGKVMPSSILNFNEEPRVGGLSRTVHASGDHEYGYEDPDEADKEYRVETSEQASQAKGGRFKSYNDDPNDITSAESEDQGGSHEELEDADVEEQNEERTVQEYVYDDESTKRRERRQAQAARERKGNRRRKEGLRRNYLLVDEFTMKPYGVGVGEWRKELMLLSKELDPAIGNINQQPEGVVAELGIRIQETWEYSAPMKFAYVKEVIARGVTLRRVDLWKKIWNNEAKPKLLLDRSWKILERQLENPASVRKSENCSGANANRVNFGRTGPSGEVGVRERLRRRLRRSPEPEEIRVEMARDKGYGGRSKLKKRNSKSMLEIEGGGGLLLDVSKRTRHVRNGSGECSRDVSADEHVEDVGIEVNTGTRVGGGRISNLSEEVIVQHLLVKSLMQRLEALEGQRSAGTIITTGIGEVEHDSESEPLKDGSKEVGLQELPGVGGGLQPEGVEGVRRSGRPKKKGKNI